MSIPEVSSRNRLLAFLQQYLGFPQNPKFFVFLASTIYNLTDNASTVVAYDTIKSDTANAFSTGTSKYTVTKAGAYYFSAQCMLNNVPTNTSAVGYLKFVHRDSAASILASYVGQYFTFHDFNSDSNFQLFPLRADALIQVGVGDTIEVSIGLDGVGGNTVDIFGHGTNLGTTGFRGFMIP
jgi:hypothetical protein